MRRCPTLPEVMAASDAVAGAVTRACVDRTEAALLAGRVGEEFDAVVLRAGGPSGGPGEVYVHEPPVLARCTGPAAARGRRRGCGWSRPTRERATSPSPRGLRLASPRCLRLFRYGIEHEAALLRPDGTFADFTNTSFAELAGHRRRAPRRPGGPRGPARR